MGEQCRHERVRRLVSGDYERLVCKDCGSPNVDAMTDDAALREAHGNRPLPFDRDTLGRMVREAWVRWARTQPAPKASWLVPYDDLAEADKEADRQIGESIARWTLIGDAAYLAARGDARMAERDLPAPDFAPPEDFVDCCWEWNGVAGHTFWLDIRVETGEVETLAGLTDDPEERQWNDPLAACLYLADKIAAAIRSGEEP